MGDFRINGSSLNIPDPAAGGYQQGEYGYKGSTLVYNEYESMTLRWSILSLSEWHELNQRIASLNGARTQCTIPGDTTEWRTVYCIMKKPTSATGLGFGRGVSVQVERISTTPG